IYGRRRHHPDQGVAGGRPGGAGTAVRGAHRRSAAAVEIEPDGHRIVPALVRLFEGTRYDAAGDRQQARTVAYRALRRQTACAPQLHLAYPELDPIQESAAARSEEHTSELQSLRHLVCRLLLEKKK